MLIQCMCSYKLDNECGVIKQLNRDGMSYKDTGKKSRFKRLSKRVLDIDIEHVSGKDINKLKEEYANACDSCICASSHSIVR